MTTNQTSTDYLRDMPPPASKEDEDAAAWAGLLGEWLGPEHDVYSRLLERDSQPFHRRS